MSDSKQTRSPEEILKFWMNIGAVIPLRAGEKHPPPTKTTGMVVAPEDRKTYSYKRLLAHMRAGGNIGIVPNDDIIGIDIDAHHSKDTWRAAEDWMDGYDPPETLKTASRKNNHLSGHLIYRLPKEHSWDETRLKARLYQNNTKFADVITHIKGYLVCEGSWTVTEEGEKVHYKIVSDTLEIADLPMEIYERLKKPPPTKVAPRSDGTYDPEVVERAEQCYKNSKLRFRFAAKGERHMRGFGAGRDLGKLYAMGGISKSDLDKQTKVLLRLGRQHSQDSRVNTLNAKAMKEIIQGGIERVEVHQEGPPDPLDPDSEHLFWHTRSQYEACMYRAAQLRVDPMAVLVSDLTMLGHSLDHRIQVKVDPYKPTLPLNLFTIVIGGPSAGKSQTVKDSYRWGQALPLVAPLRGDLRSGEHGAGSVKGLRLPKKWKRMSCQPMQGRCSAKTGSAIGNWFLATVVEELPLGKDAKEGAKPKIRKHPKMKVRSRMLLHYDEPDDLFNFTGQRFNLHSILRTAFLADELNPQTAGSEGAWRLEENDYTVSMIASMLPVHMQEVKKWGDTGLLQRCIYVDVTNKNRELSDYVVEHPDTYIPKAEREPTAHWKASDGEGLVEFEPSVYKDVSRMLDWASGAEDYKYPLEDRERWMGLSHDSTLEAVAQHMSVRLLRVAALLAMYNGVPMKDGRVTVPHKYYEDAQAIMRRSAFDLNDNIIQARVRAKKIRQDKAKAQGDSDFIRDKERRAKEFAAVTPTEWVDKYFIDKKIQSIGRSDLQRHLGKKKIPNVRVLIEAIEKSTLVTQTTVKPIKVVLIEKEASNG